MNRFMLTGLVAAMLIVGMVGEALRETVAAAASADPGLVGWWKLDDEGVDLAVDSSMGGHDGILYGDPWWVPGHTGEALHFDGYDDYVDTYYYENLPVWTVSAWVISPRAPQAPGVGGPVHRQANYQFNWDHHDTNFQGTAALLIGGTWYPASFGPLFANQWYHLAATFDGSSLKAYADGDLITTNTAAQGIPAWEPASLKIGRHASDPWYFEGAVDEVRVYNRALTQEEIENLTHYVPWDAKDPQPVRSGSLDIRDANAISWSAGQGAAMHDVYFGTDANTVETAEVDSPVYRGRQAETTFSVAGLVEVGIRYFWRIDEVEADGVTVHKGALWSFTVFGLSVVDNFESYTNEEGHRLIDAWIDGSANGTGSYASRSVNPSGPWVDDRHGTWCMALDYDNTRSPFISEVEREFAPEQDWTTGGMGTLSLWFQGDAVSFGETSPGTFTMSATGADIWNDGDQFRYAYKRLDGDGSIVVRVERVGRTDSWAKAGVMIRESLDPASAHAFMLVTPDGLRAFQNRAGSYAACLSAHSWNSMSIPTWLKLERKGNQFTGYHSVDGVNWIKQSETDHTEADASPNPQSVYMAPYVYVGLALTSHAWGAVTTAAFSGVEITGEVIGPWQVAEIGVDQPGNSPDDLYVVVEDSNGVEATVVHPGPTAVNATTWTEWRIPRSDLVGVDLGHVRKMAIGVGGRETAIPPGTGRIYIDDIGLSKGTANSVFGIYLAETGELALSDQDMAAYTWATHEIELNESGITKWNSYLGIDPSRTRSIPRLAGLYQQPFVARVGDREIYRGHFWSALSSLSCDGIVILDTALPCSGTHKTISIENGYPSPLENGGDDLRDDAELFDLLAAKGLLR